MSCAEPFAPSKPSPTTSVVDVPVLPSTETAETSVSSSVEAWTSSDDVSDESESVRELDRSISPGPLRVRVAGPAEGVVASRGVMAPVLAAGVATAAMMGDERGELSTLIAATSRSATFRPPSLAMLPVSTRIDETDMAPGVRAPDGIASRRSLRPVSASETVEPEGDATGVGSPCGVAALAVSACCPVDEPSRLIARLAGLDPPLLLPASLPVVGLPAALELLGLTTFRGTAALPPPRLTTRGFSSSAKRLPPPL